MPVPWSVTLDISVRVVGFEVFCDGDVIDIQGLESPT